MSSFPRIIMPVGVLILFFYCCDGTCEFCSYTNQTTTHSKCSETCGGGERYYFHYVCCANFTKHECERECNISLTLTKSVQIFEGCNKNCSKGGTYNDTTERCDCPEGTGGRCCNQFPPKVKRLSQQDIIEGRDLSVTCQATPGNPNSTTFYWTKVDNPGFSQKGSILQILNVQRNSSGTYTCTAENSYNNGERGTHSQPLDVNIQYPPKVKRLSQQDIIEGRDLSVTCQATPGNPNSTTFYWTKVDNPGFSQKGSILHIHNVQRNSSGTYICTAENSYNNGEKGTHSQPLDVNVQYANRSIGKKSAYLNVGLPLGLVLLLAIVVVIVYGWCMNRKRNLRVNITNTRFGEEVHGYSNI